MYRALSDLSAFSGIFLFVVLPSLVSALLAVVVRRTRSIQQLRENNEFAAITYPVVGLFYGVFLAFAIVMVWQRFTDAEDSSYREVSALAELWRDADPMPVPTRDRIHAHIRDYVTSVVEQEWPAMARPRADLVRSAPYEDMRKTYQSLEMGSDVEKAFFSRSLDELDAVGDARRQRLIFSNSEMPGLVWGFLLFGAVVTTVYSYFLGTKHSLTHAAACAALTSVIGFSLLLIMDLQYPFEGAIRVDSAPYTDLLLVLGAR